MSEILRFRMARAPQRAVIGDTDRLQVWGAKIFDEWHRSDGNESDLAEFFLRGQGMMLSAHAFTSNEQPVKPMLEAVRKLDRLLLADANEVGWNRLAPEFQKIFGGDARAVVGRRAWARLRDLLSAWVQHAPDGDALRFCVWPHRRPLCSLQAAAGKDVRPNAWLTDA